MSENTGGDDARQIGEQTPPKKLLDGYLTMAEAADQFGVKPRTIGEWMAKPNGLPFTKLGRSKIINIDRAREWLERREQARNQTKSSRAQRRPAGR